MPVCPSCGQDNPASARFCMACGTPLPVASPAPGATRKVVTIVFCDVVGFTPLGERLDAESVRNLMTRFFGEMRSVVQRHGGTVEKYIGDAVMAVFGVPLLHEDDAVRAVRAAAEMRSALLDMRGELEGRWGASIQVRIGVNTGEVVVGDASLGGSLVVGDAVNVAARLEQTATPGEILLGADTYALVRDVVDAEPVEPLTLKGKTDLVVAYRLRDVPAPGAPARAEPAIVDRVPEVGALRAVFDDVVATRRCRMVVVLGSAGVGKSRLAREFAAGVAREAAVLWGRCLPYGDGITFWPVAEVVRAAAAIDESDDRDGGRAKIDAVVAGAEDAALISERVAGATGFGAEPADIQETFWAIRRFLECLASERSLVVVFDDVQWAEPTFLDLVEYVAGRSRDVPIVLLCLGRPDLLDVRTSWGALAGEARSISLRPFEPPETEELVGNILGPSRLEPRSIARITDASGGNPLFVEEVLRMLEDDGLLRREDGGWVADHDLSTVSVPATIHALVGARLDRLGPDERAVIRSAAVVGKEFWWGAVAVMVPEGVRASAGAHLQTLVRKELIGPAASALPGEDAFEFHHLLIQEIAYAGIPKETRAELHARFADWLEARAGDRMQEHEEVLGYHLEQAFLARADLGEPTADDRRLAERAAERLSAAGRRAHARGDMPAAADLLGRAARLWPADDPRRRSLLPDLGEALMETGDLAGAEEVLAAAVAESTAAGERGVASHATVIRMLMLESTEPKARSEEALRELQSVLPVFEELGDEAGLARAWRLVGDVHLARGRYGLADEALRNAVEHARLAGATWDETEALGQYVGSGVYGPVPVEDVEARCRDILERGRGNPAMSARGWRGLAHVAAMRGDLEQARTLAERSHETLEDLGLRLRAAFAAETLGFIEHLADDHEAAERALLAGFSVANELGEQGYTSTVAALLSRELAEQGRLDEADAMIETSSALGAEDDLTTQALWRAAKALVLSLRGSDEEAERYAREAVEIAAETEDLNMRADVLVQLGAVAAARDPGAAVRALTEALDLYRAKGNVTSAAEAERRVAALRARRGGHALPGPG